MGQTMMPKRASESKGKSKLLIAAVLAGCILTFACVVWWLQPRVELTEHTYELTLALYRVCNQRSVDGLVQIENDLNDETRNSAPADQSYVAVERV